MISNIYNPPYISINKLNDVFNILYTRSLPQVTVQEFINRGFGKSDAFATITALRFLGLIKEDGTKTENLNKLQLRGEDRKEAIKEIVLKAYSDLFNTTPEANKLPRDELYNEFLAVYKLSSRLASTAAPAFLWLCSQAGLEVSEESEIRLRKDSTKNARNAEPRSTTPVKPEEKIASNIVEISNETAPNLQATQLNLSYGTGKMLVPDKLNRKDIETLKLQIDIFARNAIEE